MKVVSITKSIMSLTDSEPKMSHLNEKLDLPLKEFFIKIFLLVKNHDENKDFVVCLDEIWSIMGYNRKDIAKDAFLKFKFIEGQHYKEISFTATGKCKKIMMTLWSFKKFCLKSRKADWIDDYLTVEKFLMETPAAAAGNIVWEKDVSLSVASSSKTEPSGDVIKPLATMDEHTQIASSSSNSLMFDGIFQGRENEIRMTPDRKWISAFDLIRVAGGQIKPENVWYDIVKKFKNEVSLFSGDFKFPGRGQKETPVINAQGVVKVLMWIPGEMAKKFRSETAKILVRYLGGDLSLINEIKAIDQLHHENPENAAQICRNDETVQQNLQFFTDDQRNNSNRLIAHFANKLDTFYGILFYRQGIQMLKIGCAPIRIFELRQKDHKSGKSGLIKNTDEMCYSFVFQMKDPLRVESEFKATKFYQDNKVDISNEKDESKKVTEVFLLNETLTAELVKEQVMKVAADRILDPPSYATVIHTDIHTDLEIEREHTKQIEHFTKQIELENVTKQLEVENVTKQKQIEFEMEKLKLEFEIMKWKQSERISLN